MNTPETPSSAQPTAETAPVVTPSEQQAPDHSATIEGLANDQIAELLDGKTPTSPEPPTPSEAAPVQEAPPVEEAPKETEQPAAQSSEQPAAQEDPAVPGDDPKIKQRVSLRFLPQDQQKETAEALERVRLGQAPDLVAALLQMRGVQQVPQPTSEQAEPPANPAPTPQAAPADVAGIETEIASLRAQRNTAIEDFDRSEELRLTALIEDKGVELAQARILATQQQSAQQVYDVQYDAAVEQLEQQFPQVLDAASPFFQLLDAKVTAAKVRNDPALADPNYILRFAEELNGVLNPTAPPSTPVPSTPAAIPPKPTTPSTVGTGLAPVSASAPRPTQADIEALVRNASPEELLAVIGDR